MKDFKKYKGTGSMTAFVNSFNELASMITRGEVILPTDNGGSDSAFFRREGDKLILDMTNATFGGGSEGGEPHFFKPVADTGADITIGYGELSQIGVGQSFFAEATHTVIGGTDVAKNYLIARYQYSDGVISLDERTTAPDPTDNVYMELEICRVWLDAGDAFFDGYYGIGRYSFGGVLLS